MDNYIRVSKEKGLGNGFYAFVLFLLAPALSLYLALKNSSELWSKNIVWIFVSFFGYTMVITSQGIDAYEYWQDLVIMHKNNDNMNFFDISEGIHGSGGSVDIFQPILTYFISFFTDSAKILFAVFGLIFGFFYSRLIAFVRLNNEKNLSFTQISLLLCFALCNPIWNINGFRFWTASIVFVYCICFYFFNKKSYFYVLLILITPLIHFSFASAVFVFIIYLVIGNRSLIYFALFVVSVFFSFFDVTLLQSLSSLYLPEVYDNRVVGYTNESYGEGIKSKRSMNNWYLKYHFLLTLWLAKIGLTYMFFKIRHFRKSQIEIHNFLGFTMLFFAFANFVAKVPSGGRFLNLALMMVFMLVIKVYPFLSMSLRRVISIGTPIMLLFIIVRIRIGFDFINITAIFGNPIISYFDDNTVPLIDLIK